MYINSYRIIHMALNQFINVDTSNVITSARGVYNAGDVSFASILQSQPNLRKLSMDLIIDDEPYWIQFTRNWIESTIPEYYPTVAHESISKLVNHDNKFSNLFRSLNYNIDLGGQGNFTSVKKPLNRDRDTWKVLNLPSDDDLPAKPRITIVDDNQRPVAGYSRYDGMIEWCIYAAIDQEEMEYILKLKQADNVIHSL